MSVLFGHAHADDSAHCRLELFFVPVRIFPKSYSQESGIQREHFKQKGENVLFSIGVEAKHLLTILYVTGWQQRIWRGSIVLKGQYR